MHYIDSNVILRFLLADHPDFSLRSRNYFSRLDRGVERGILLESVLIEVIFTLTSKRTYARPNRLVADGLLRILAMPALAINNRGIHLIAMELFGQNRIDYLDCLHITTARLQGPDQILSFDRDFDGFNGVTRIEP